MKYSQLLIIASPIACSAFAPSSGAKNMQMQMQVQNNKPFDFDTTRTRTRTRTTTTTLFNSEIMSEIDIMCVANTAELCSKYDECDIAEREAIINRFEEQTDTLAERLAMMQALTHHLVNGDNDGHVHPSEEEIGALKTDILGFVADKKW
jgi:hypothetical protein